MALGRLVVPGPRGPSRREDSSPEVGSPPARGRRRALRGASANRIDLRHTRAYLGSPSPGDQGFYPQVRPCRVLVVDDEETIRDVVADALKLEGYPVETAANGLEALRVVERHSPALILLDMRMPVLDGWGFTEKLRQAGYQVPIVVITAAQNARRWADEIGAQAYLSKPFDLDDLFRLVERFCEGG